MTGTGENEIRALNLCGDLDGDGWTGLSSGVMRDQNDPGFANDSTSHGYNSQPPASYLTAHGGSLPGGSNCSGTCPGGSGANDGVNLRLTIRVPTNVEGLELWHRFFAADFPTYACTTYHDFFLILLDTTAPSLPPDGNIAFDVFGNPLSLNAYFEVCTATGCHTCPSGPGDLAGTGLTVGGGMIWRKAVGPVVPGETITLDVMVFDVSDTIGDVISLVDGFAWIPKPGTTPVP